VHIEFTVQGFSNDLGDPQSPADWTKEEERKLVRKFVDWIVMPRLILDFLALQVDRGNMYDETKLVPQGRQVPLLISYGMTEQISSYDNKVGTIGGSGSTECSHLLNLVILWCKPSIYPDTASESLTLLMHHVQGIARTEHSWKLSQLLSLTLKVYHALELRSRVASRGFCDFCVNILGYCKLGTWWVGWM
jgi:hypothetical protein